MAAELPVFVGSTFIDLQEHRAAVLYALQRLETVARGMEHFGSRPDTPKEECLRLLRDCKVYIGIFAMRYGSIDEESGKSITELEYEEAGRFHLRRLIYLIDEAKQPVLPMHIDFGVQAEKLAALKSRCKAQHVVSFFTTPEDLAMRVTQDLTRLMQERGITIQESALSRIVANLPRETQLDDDDYRWIKQKLGVLCDPIDSDIILKEAIQFLLVGDNMSAAFLVVQSTPLTLFDTLKLLRDISVAIGHLLLDGFKSLQREGKVSAQFVELFEQHLRQHRRIPILPRRLMNLETPTSSEYKPSGGESEA